MTDATADGMAKKTVQRDSTAPTSALGRHYREIGISAVAAAARYQGVGEKPVIAQTARNDRADDTD